jgi:hypothetical protein
MPSTIPTIAPTGSGLDSFEEDERAAPAVVAEASDSVTRDEADKDGSLSVTSGSATASEGESLSLVSSVMDGCLVVVLVRTNGRLGEEVVAVRESVTFPVSVNLKVGTSFEDEGEGEGWGLGVTSACSEVWGGCGVLVSGSGSGSD